MIYDFSIHISGATYVVYPDVYAIPAGLTS